MPDEAQTQGQEQSETPDFAAWLQAQPDEVKSIVGGKIDRLHADLHTERLQRKDFVKQLRELEGKAEKGSEAEKALGETLTRAEQAELRATFAEEAIKPEIGCTNPKAAFLVAQAEGLFTRRGEPDWTAIKAAAPELFGRTKAPPGNGGNGRESPPARTGGMNEFIRAATGR